MGQCWGTQESHQSWNWPFWGLDRCRMGKSFDATRWWEVQWPDEVFLWLNINIHHVKVGQVLSKGRSLRPNQPRKIHSKEVHRFTQVILRCVPLKGFGVGGRTNRSTPRTVRACISASQDGNFATSYTLHTTKHCSLPRAITGILDQVHCQQILMWVWLKLFCIWSSLYQPMPQIVNLTFSTRFIEDFYWLFIPTALLLKCRYKLLLPQLNLIM